MLCRAPVSPCLRSSTIAGSYLEPHDFAPIMSTARSLTRRTWTMVSALPRLPSSLLQRSSALDVPFPSLCLRCYLDAASSRPLRLLLPAAENFVIWSRGPIHTPILPSMDKLYPRLWASWQECVPHPRPRLIFGGSGAMAFHRHMKTNLALSRDMQAAQYFCLVPPLPRAWDGRSHLQELAKGRDRTELLHILWHPSGQDRTRSPSLTC